MACKYSGAVTSCNSNWFKKKNSCQLRGTWSTWSTWNCCYGEQVPLDQHDLFIVNWVVRLLLSYNCFCICKDLLWAWRHNLVESIARWPVRCSQESLHYHEWWPYFHNMAKDNPPPWKMRAHKSRHKKHVPRGPQWNGEEEEREAWKLQNH